MSRGKVYERPTPSIKYVDGVLRQEWRIQWRDHDTMGAANPETFEWRDVQTETFARPHRTTGETT